MHHHIKSILLFGFNYFSVIVFISSCESKRSILTSSVSGSSLSYNLQDATQWDPSWSDSNVVNVQILADPDNLHPTNGSSQIRDEVLMYLHGALIKTDLQNGNISPGICESMPMQSNNSNALTFQIKKGVRWDNGAQVNASDVSFTIKASKCQLTNNISNKFFFDNVEDVIIDSLNNLKFAILFKNASEYNLPMWCDYAILQESKYDFNNTLHDVSFHQLNNKSFLQEKNAQLIKWANQFNSDDMCANPSFISGMGPYKLERWERGQFISIIKKQNHWTSATVDNTTKAFPEKIIFRISQDPAVQKASFLTQLYDASGAFPTRLLLELQQNKLFNKNYNSKFIDTYGYTYIALNTQPDGLKHPMILNDLNVRKALAYSSQIDNMIKVVNKGINKRVAGPVAPLKKECNNDLVLIPFDITKANELLNKSGWVDSNKDGVREKLINNKPTPLVLELAYLNTIPDWKEMAMVIAEGMMRAGIKINLVSYDYPTWLEKLTTHDFDLAMGSWNTSSLPEDYSQLWSTASYAGNGNNYSGFGNTSSDSLIFCIAKETNVSKKISLELKMQQLIYDEQPYIFMYGLVRRCVLHKRFSNARFYAERPGIFYSPLKLNSLHQQSSVNN